MLDDPVAWRWLTTWTHLRQRRCTQVDGWPLVHVEAPSRRTELVVVDPGPQAFLDLTSHVAGDDRAMLTVVGPDLVAYRDLDLPHDVRVDRDDETLMTVRMPTGAPPPPPPGLVASVEVDGPRTTYRLDDDRRLAAEGTMAVIDGWVTFDAVETTPAYRRRGLGRHVMQVLSSRATDAGAGQGVLAASAEGGTLYTSLGWTVERELLSIMGAVTPRER